MRSKGKKKKKKKNPKGVGQLPEGGDNGVKDEMGENREESYERT